MTALDKTLTGNDPSHDRAKGCAQESTGDAWKPEAGSPRVAAREVLSHGGLTPDQRRLADVAKFIDCIGGIDLHQTASYYASLNGRADEPEPADYYRAVCDGIHLYKEGYGRG